MRPTQQGLSVNKRIQVIHNWLLVLILMFAAIVAVANDHFPNNSEPTVINEDSLRSPISNFAEHTTSGFCLEASNNGPLCVGQTLELYATDGADSYLWTGPNGFTSTEQNPVIPDAGIELDSFFTVTAIGGPCPGTVNTPVLIKVSLDATAQSNSPVCIGDNIELSSFGGFSYNWTGPNNFSSIDDDPTITDAGLDDAGVYNIIVTAGICLDTVSVQVEVLPDFSVETNITPADCDEEGAIAIEVSGGIPPYSYDWADLPGNVNPEDRTNLSTGTYEVTIYDGSGCGAPFNELVVGDLCNCGADAGSIVADEDFICLENGSVTITATSNGDQSVPNGFETIYVLTEGDDLIILEVNSSPSFTVTEKGEYTIHTLIYDPATLDLSIVQLGTTSAVEVLSLILQGGGDICAALDVIGAPVDVSGVTATINSNSPAACDLCNGFVVLAPSSNTYNWSDGGSGASRSDLCSGFYNITVTDNNGCSSELSLTVADDCENCEDINVLNIVAVETSCGNETGSILIELDNPANYSYDWSPDAGTSNANDNGRTNLASGVYTVEITDLQDLDCTASLLIPVGISDGPVIQDVISTPSNCSAADGSITILPASFEYVWVADGFVGNSRSDLTSGPHDVIVTDPSNPDCPDIITVQVGEVNDLTAEAIINNSPTCGEANGTVTINLLSGGGPNMSFQWNNGGDDVTENNLTSGAYSVLIINEDTGCSFGLIFGLTDDVGPVEVIVDPFYQVSCVGSTDAEITFDLNPSDDFAGPPTVIITDAAGNTFDNGQLGPGQYCVIVNDANGCIAGIGCVNVVQPAALDVDVTLTQADCQTGGSITVTTFGGNPNYTYDWADLPGTDNEMDRFDLAPGTYNLTVTDDNGCSAIADNLVIINDCGDCQTPPVVNSIIIVDSNCDQADGQAIINMSTNFADFTYDWTPDAGIPNVVGNSRSNLPAGSYSVLITNINDPACFIEENITIGNEDGPQVDVESTTPSSCSVSNGSAILTTLPGLTYIWSDTGFGPERFDLAAGDYQVTVNDVATGCFTIIPIEIGLIDELEVSLNVVAEPDCNEANGSVSVEVEGGSGSYFYSWGPTTTLINLTAGPYEITVTDLTTGCTGEALIVLTDDVVGAEIEFQETVETTCPGAADGFNDFAFLPEPGFVGPPSISIVDADGNTFTNGQLPVGDYCIIIEDANGCLAESACFEVVSAGQITVDISITPVTCTALGSIDLEVLGTNGPYIYNWADVAGNNNSPDRFGLTAGLYSVTITDAFGCEITAEDLVVLDDCTITPDCVEPVITNLTTVEATCGDSNGSATINLSGNEATDYTYLWSPNVSSTNSAFNIPSGVYSVTIANVTDENCNTVLSFSIQNSDGPQSEILSSTPATCTQANGTAVASPPNFIYEWCSGTIGFNGLNLPAGICFVTVTDPATGCTNILEAEIEEVNTLDAEIVIDENPNCGSDNGVASVLVIGGSTNYSYEWSDGGSGAIRNDLEAGVYSVTVTDLGATGCALTVVFDLLNDLEISEQATITFGGNGSGNGQVSCAGSEDGFVDVDVTPGPDFAGEPTIVIVDADGNTYNNGSLPPGEYCIQVTDENDCLAASACFEIGTPEAIDINAVLTNQTCDDLGNIQLTVTGGTAPYLFDWEDLAGNNNPPNRVALEAGSYSVIITDADACTTESISFTIIDECALCPSTATAQLILPQFNVDSFCVEIESCFDTPTTTFQLLSGGVAGSSANGFWSLNPEGCLFYNSTGNTGANLDTIYVLASDNGLVDTTCIFVTVTQPCFGLTGLDSVLTSTYDCVAGGNFCLPVPITQIGLYEFFDNGTPYNNGFAGCDFQMISTYNLQELTDLFPTGPYSLDSWIVNGTQFTLDTFVDLAQLVAQMNIWDPAGGWFLNLDGNIQGGFSANDYGFLDITHLPTGISFTNTFALGTLNLPVGTLFAVDTGYHEIVMIELSTGCTDTIFVEVLCNQCPDIYTGPLLIETEECDELTEVCTEIAQGNLSNYLITDNGIIYETGFVGCDFDTLPPFYSATNFNLGSYTLESWIVNSDTFALANFNNVQQLVDSMNIWDPLGNWTLDNNEFITAGNLVNTYGDLVISQLGSPFGVYGLNIPIVAGGTAIALEPGIHELVFTDTFTGCVDSVSLEIACVACPDYQGPGVLFTFNCDEDALLCLDVPTANLDHYEFFDNGQPYVGALLGCDFDTLYTYSATDFLVFGTYTVQSWTINGIPNFLGFFSTLDELVFWMNNVDPGGNWNVVNGVLLTGGTPGNEYGDLIVSNFGSVLPTVVPAPQLTPNGVGLNLDLGLHQVIISDTIVGCLDTVNVVVQCLTEGLPDTIYLDVLNGFSDTFCIDIDYLPGNLDTIYNFCENVNAADMNVDLFLLDTAACFAYTGIEVGQDTACFAFCDDLGNCDSLYVIIDVIPPSIDTIPLTVILTDTDTICFDVSELPGEEYTISNFCPGLSGDFVLFNAQSDTVCVLYTGVAIGVDTACYEICDEFGYCDTTILIVETILDPNGTGPIAVDDDTTGLINTATIIDVIDNDILNGTLAEIVIITDPVNGIAVLNADFTVSYVPDAEFCGELDSFMYALITSSGTDTATVYIDVFCDELTVYTGFSPNEDGVNDGLNIKGINSFPNNLVRIYNRWGNEVFKQKGYSNDDPWKGLWKGKDLPDGTYFYVIDDGEGRQYSGYVQMHR